MVVDREVARLGHHCGVDVVGIGKDRRLTMPPGHDVPDALAAEALAPLCPRIRWFLASCLATVGIAILLSGR